MVLPCAARIEDLGPGDYIRVSCLACSHDELIPSSSFLHGYAAADNPDHGSRTLPLPRVRREGKGGCIGEVGGVRT